MRVLRAERHRASIALDSNGAVLPIIINKFWCFLIKNSFHILVRLTHSGPCIFIALCFPCLLYALLCFILPVFVNLLWGLFPIVGFLFTILASVNNFRSLIKVILISILLHFFIQIVFGENLVFCINVVLISSLIGVSEARSDLSQVVPIVVYIRSPLLGSVNKSPLHYLRAQKSTKRR